MEKGEMCFKFQEENVTTTTTTKPGNKSHVGRYWGWIELGYHFGDTFNSLIVRTSERCLPLSLGYYFLIQFTSPYRSRSRSMLWLKYSQTSEIWLTIISLHYLRLKMYEMNFDFSRANQSIGCEIQLSNSSSIERTDNWGLEISLNWDKLGEADGRKRLRCTQGITQEVGTCYCPGFSESQEDNLSGVASITFCFTET